MTRRFDWSIIQYLLSIGYGITIFFACDLPMLRWKVPRVENNHVLNCSLSPKKGEKKMPAFVQ
jgi:hypothetical protein